MKQMFIGEKIVGREADRCGYESKDLIPQQRSLMNRPTCTTKPTSQFAGSEASIVNRSTPSILCTATFIVGCLLQQIEPDVGRTAPAKAIAARVLGFFSALMLSTQLSLIAFFSSLSLSNVVKAIAGSTIIAMSPLSRHGLGIGPQSGECKVNSLCTIALPVSESKGPNWRKWRIFLCVILDSSTGASWGPLWLSSDLVGKT